MRYIIAYNRASNRSKDITNRTDCNQSNHNPILEQKEKRNRYQSKEKITKS